jgi:hypothetical protein
MNAIHARSQLRYWPTLGETSIVPTGRRWGQNQKTWSARPGGDSRPQRVVELVELKDARSLRQR